MSKMLNFFDRLLTAASHLEKLGLNHQACRAYQRLANMRHLPEPVARATQSRLGELRLELGRYASARKHLIAALVREPNNAHLHHLLANALAEGPKADAERAAHHFRRAIELDLDNAEYLLAFARHSLDNGQREQGLDLLRQAGGLAVDDAEMLGEIAAELRSEGEYDEARAHVRLALFRHGRDARFRQLWEQHQFHTLRAQQQEERRESVEDDAPTILSFTPSAPTQPLRVVGRRVIRKDEPAERRGPHAPKTRRLPR